MKSLFLAIALVCAGSVAAQDAPAPAQQQKDEVRALSGTLKETLGRVHSQLKHVEQQISTATPEVKEKWSKAQADLTAMKGSVEVELRNVNMATAETWSAVKTKANEVNAQAAELLGKLKKEGTAVN